MVVIGELIVGDCRSMAELQDSSVHFIVTSPPYWHLKDYSVEGQIGYGQSLHEYLTDLYRVWTECLRVLKSGRRLCINIGDQFARASIYGRYKIIPLHAEVISQCEQLGFDFMGSIIWQKRTTMNTSGGAPIMGSYPFPPNGLPEFDYEHILIFKKPDVEPKAKVPLDVKERSKLTKDEWKEHFSGHWRFAGARKLGHEAIFPEELPRRLIRMFSFHGETVLDPFLGSGTTMKAAIELGRMPIGYEINGDYLKVVMEKLGNAFDAVKVVERKGQVPSTLVDYTPRIQNAMPVIDPQEESKGMPFLQKVIGIVNERTLELEGGRKVGLLGVKVPAANRKMVLRYLEENLRSKKVIIKDDGDPSEGYVYLKNKIFINAYLIKSCLGIVDKDRDFSMKARFLKMKKA